MSATTGFIPSYKQQLLSRERKILEKLKNSVQRTLGLCTTIYACVYVCVDYICVIVCGCISDI